MQKIFEEVKKDREKQQGIICIFAEIICLILVACFLKDFQKSKAEMIIVFVVVCVMAVLLGLFAFKKIVFYCFVFGFLIVTGGLSLLIQPVFNIPDEVAHFARAEIVSSGNFIQNPAEQEFETIRSLEDLTDNIKKSYPNSSLKGKKIDYTPIKTKHVAATNLSFLYFPQAIGIFIAKFLHMDIIWLLWLGRFMNLLAYSILVAMAIKIAPKLKFFLFFIAALPISVQQAASFSPDAFINGTAILFVGYFLNLYSKREDRIPKKEILVFTFLGTIVAVSKVTNIFMMGLFLLIPSSRFEDRKKETIIKCIAIIVVIFFGGTYYLYTTNFAPNLEHLPYLEGANVNSEEQLQYILDNTRIWMQKFGFSIINRVAECTDMLSEFGWLEYNYSILSVVMIFIFGKMCFRESGVIISRFSKFLILLMTLGIYCTTCLALYLTWTPVGADDVVGIQGRYFIPMLLLLILLFTSNKDNRVKKESYIIDLTVINFMIGAMFIVTTARYY